MARRRLRVWPGQDIFKYESDAVSFLTKGHTIQEKIVAKVIVGLHLTCNPPLLLLAPKLGTICTLFDVHRVYRLGRDLVVSELPVLWDSGRPSTPEKLRQYFSTVAHYLCPTYDLRQVLGPFSQSVDCRWNCLSGKRLRPSRLAVCVRLCSRALRASTRPCRVT
jgi:hypothetical protein